MVPNSLINNEEKHSILYLVLHKLLKFRHNRNLLFLIFFLLISEIGFAYFDNMGPVEMLDNGMNQNVYAFIFLMSIFWEGFAGYCVAVYSYKREMRVLCFYLH
jgi:hypothetical protein